MLTDTLRTLDLSVSVTKKVSAMRSLGPLRMILNSQIGGLRHAWRCTVDIDHEVPVRTSHIPYDFHGGDVFGQTQPANLALEPAMALGDQHLDFITQLCIVFAFALISTGYIARHFAAMLTKQPA